MNLINLHILKLIERSKIGVASFQSNYCTQNLDSQ